ncbi:MAG TPA: branched-chain amino acid aminotransferase [Acholeplasma sp.]|jgi:branched-chain amino acid aminotransferase
MVKGFKYHGSDYAFFMEYKDGAWGEGEIEKSIDFTISALASALQYGQSVFEGLKAYRSKDNHILLFRPDANAKRFATSCERLMMPTIPEDVFIDAVTKIVLMNEHLIPDYESKGSLYIRPFMIGTEAVLGVRPSNTYLFCIVVSAVGSYFANGFGTIKLQTSPYDRAAPNGLGHIKAGANYGASLYPKHLAKEAGFDDCLYLDPKTHTKLDETGATNVIAITDKNEFITPQSTSILPSITNHSLQVIAKDFLNMKVLKKEIYITDLPNYVEFGACGTAAVLTPVEVVEHEGTRYTFKKYDILHKLYDYLTGIQFGDIKEPYRWVRNIK